MVNTSVTWFSLRIWGARLFLHRTLGVFRFDLCNHPRYLQKSCTKMAKYLVNTPFTSSRLIQYQPVYVFMMFIFVVCQSLSEGLPRYSSPPYQLGHCGTPRLKRSSVSLCEAPPATFQWIGFTGKCSPETHGFLPTNRMGFNRFKCSHPIP